MSAPEFDPFYSAKVRIERAKEHIDDLDSKIAQFWAKQPYTHAVEDDTDGVHKIHKLKFTERFPFRWRILGTEIIEHLRASLDHATWATAWLETGDPDVEQTAFPFASSAAELDNSIRRRSKNLPPEILTLLRTFEPYDGGNEALYVLNGLCNLTKHALIAFVAAAAFDPQFRVYRQTSPIDLLLPLAWDSEKHEIPYARVARDFDFQHEANFKAFIALQYRGETSSDSAVAVFKTLLSEAERVVLAIEAEYRRIRPVN